MTLRSVAEKAGVAVDTARKVLRGDPSVRPYIRQRVQRVIRQTGYRPNLVARALRQSHLDLVPLSVMRLDIPYFGRLATRLSEKLVEWGAEPALCLDAKHLMAMCRSYAPRGCIIMNHVEEADLRELAGTQKIVVVNQRIPHVEGVGEILIDFEAAFRALARAVLARGRRRVAVVSSYYLEAARRGWVRQKFPGVLDELAGAGLSTVGPEPGHVFESAAELGAWLAAHPGGADAALCENDNAGAAAVGELARLGLSTPRDVLVAGCDAVLSVAGMWSIRPDTDAIAETAVSMLRAMIDDGAPAGHVVHVPVPVDETGKPLA